MSLTQPKSTRLVRDAPQCRYDITLLSVLNTQDRRRVQLPVNSRSGLSSVQAVRNLFLNPEYHFFADGSVVLIFGLIREGTELVATLWYELRPKF